MTDCLVQSFCNFLVSRCYKINSVWKRVVRWNTRTEAVLTETFFVLLPIPAFNVDRNNYKFTVRLDLTRSDEIPSFVVFISTVPDALLHYLLNLALSTWSFNLIICWSCLWSKRCHHNSGRDHATVIWGVITVISHGVNISDHSFPVIRPWLRREDRSKVSTTPCNHARIFASDMPWGLMCF